MQPQAAAAVHGCVVFAADMQDGNGCCLHGLLAAQ
jgi:hypothetical protein